jgi:hypothetical protein
VPLQALIAASNELPTDQEELNALYDRFLVRSFVDYVREENLPLLFANAQDLMGLDSIGQKGYYFRQTVDIDCNAITTWHTINLQGHYDGGGHFVQYKTGYETCALFQSIQAQSSVKHLELRDLCLAKNADNSTITACQSGIFLISSNATNSTITDCLVVMNITEGDFLGGIAKTLKSSGVW